MKPTMTCPKLTRKTQTSRRILLLAGLQVLVCGLFANLIAGQEPLPHISPAGQEIERIPTSSRATGLNFEGNNDFVPVPVTRKSGNNGAAVHVDNQVSKAGFNDDVERRPLHDMVTQSRQPDYPWTYQLKNLNYQQFEGKLSNIWGKRLMGKPLDPEQRLLRIYFPEGKSAPEQSMRFDRVNGLLTFEGSKNRKQGWHALMQALDRRESPHDRMSVKVIDVGMADQSFVRQISYLVQDGPANQQDQDVVTQEIPSGLTREQFNEQLNKLLQNLPEFEGRPTIRHNPETGTIFISGEKEDVDKLAAFVNRMIESATAMGSVSESIPLFNSQPTQAAEIIQALYDSQFAALKGPASIVANPNSSSLLAVGSRGAIDAIKKLVQQLDAGTPGAGVPPDELTDDQKGFVTYRLKFLSAVTAQRIVDQFFGQSANIQSNEPREAAPVTTIVEERSNLLMITAGPELRNKAVALLKEIDTPNNVKNREIRVFAIRNQVAGDIAVLLQDVLNGGQQQNLGLTESQLTPPQNQGNFNQPGAGGQVPAQTGITNLKIENSNGQVEDGGILFDARVSSNNASNSIIVVAPEETMGLIAELIKQLDHLPDIVSEVKVFPIINGDAGEILSTIQTIFTGGQQQQQQQQGALANLPLQSPGSDGSSLLNLRFAVNERTNTIIASGSVRDLEFVEALIQRLDEKDVNDRQTRIYRLSNAFATDVSTAINNWLSERETILQGNPITGGGQFGTGVTASRRDVIVVDEAVSNSLIVNARMEYFAEVERIIEALDRRPPLVKVKAMIVQVDLNQLENFGVEFGIQDSSIFDAGLSNTIGTGFVDLQNVAGQLVSDLGVGRMSGVAGIPGFVLSAGDESLNFLMRFLKQKGCANILFTPQVMTLENLEGRVTVGAQIQRAGGVTQVVGAGVTQDIENVDTGITLAVTPRVSPDGMIVMFVDVQNTALGAIADGTVIGTDINGNAIFSRPINQTAVQTAIMCRSGQTVAITGLIQDDKSQSINTIPILGDLPVIGPLFQSVENSANRSETLIILTPYIADGPDDLNAFNEDEFSRMHWCNSDVARLYGTTSYTGSPYHEQTPKIYYPDSDPLGANPQTNGRQPVLEQFPRTNRASPNGTMQNGTMQNGNPPPENILPIDNGWRNGEINGSGNRNVAPPTDGSSTRNFSPNYPPRTSNFGDPTFSDQAPPHPNVGQPIYNQNRDPNYQQFANDGRMLTPASRQSPNYGQGGPSYQQTPAGDGRYAAQQFSNDGQQGIYQLSDGNSGRRFRMHPPRGGVQNNYR